MTWSENNYCIEKAGLSEAEVVNNVKAFVGSEYFSEYHLWDGHIDTNFCKIQRLGGFTVEPGRVFRLRDITPFIENTLDKLTDPEFVLETVNLELIPPLSLKRKLRFSEEQNYSLRLPLNLSAGRIDEPTYRFSIRNFGLDSMSYSTHQEFEDDRKSLQEWYGDIDAEFKRILPLFK